MALKIIAFPMPERVLREVTGELEAIDGQNGTLLIEQKPLGEEGEKTDLVYFLFDPSKIEVMRAPRTELVRLVLNPGDIVKVEYWVGGGARRARSITLISEASVSGRTTTRSTTTETTVTR